MALSGIPIREEQCIGDSLEIINAAFQTLDTKTSVPIGTVITYAGVGAPDGFFVCDGSTRAKNEYTALYVVLTNNGTRFPFGADTGAPDNRLFKLPNYSSSFPTNLIPCVKY